jgi:F-type H+-transporting ATPase subunit alpha
MADSSFRVIRIVTSVELDPEKAKRIAARFAEHFKINEYEIRQEIDASIIGGMIIFAGGYRYDYSIRGQLGRITTQLKSQKSLAGDQEATDENLNALIKGNLTDALSLFDELPVAPGGHDIFFETEPVAIQSK